MKKSLKKIIKFISVASLFTFIFISAIIISTRSQSTISLTPTNFQPVKITTATFVVRDSMGNELATINSNSAMNHYAGDAPAANGDRMYPAADIMFSQPYSCAIDGEYIENINDVHHSTSAMLYVNDKLYFLNEYYFGVNVGARTYARPKLTFAAPALLNPLRGATIGYNPVWQPSGPAWVDPGAPSNPDGNLVLLINTGPWSYQSGSKVAQITGLLESQDFQVTSWNPAPRPGYTLEDSIHKLQTEWGNSKIVIQPSITISALSDYLRYSYSRAITLPNGTAATVNMKTTSAKVGFVDCYQTDYDAHGLVPNLLTPSEKNNLVGLNTEYRSDGKETVKTGNDQSTGVFAISSYTVEGHVKYLNDVQDANGNPVLPIGGGARSYNHVNSLGGQPIQIDLNNLDQFSLPQTLVETSEFELQPLTTLKLAKTECQAQVMFWNGFWNTYDKYSFVNSNLVYPYSITEQNVYALGQFVFKCAIISENDPEIVVNGHPVDPDSITDFEITSFGLEPTINDFKESLQKTPWYVEYMGLIVAIIVAVVIIIMIFAVINKPGHKIVKIGWNVK